MNTHDDLPLWHAQRTRHASIDPVTYAQGWEPHVPVAGPLAWRMVRAVAWMLAGAALVMVLL